jgi:hypothetical protein
MGAFPTDEANRGTAAVKSGTGRNELRGMRYHPALGFQCWSFSSIM